MLDGSLVAEPDTVLGQRGSNKSNPRPTKAILFILAALVFLAFGVFLYTLTPAPQPVGRSASRLKSEWLKLYEKRKYSQAAIKLNEYLKIVPRDWRARDLLGEIYWQTGDINLAFKALSGADKLAPARADRLYRLGLLAGQLEQKEAAVKYLSKAVKEEPQSMIFRVELAKAFDRAGDYDRAISGWHQALGLLPQRDFYAAVLYAELGDTYKRRGDKDKAAESYRQGLAIEPSNVYLNEKLAEVDSD